jgi:hypothetical protein
MLVPNESAKFSLRMLASTAQPSLAASAGCFVTAGFGFVLNLFAPDAICAEGLAGVGCFYFAIGAFDLARVRRRESRRRITEPSHPFT